MSWDTALTLLIILIAVIFVVRTFSKKVKPGCSSQCGACTNASHTTDSAQCSVSPFVTAPLQASSCAKASTSTSKQSQDKA